jgi:hypothetical protein
MTNNSAKTEPPKEDTPVAWHGPLRRKYEAILHQRRCNQYVEKRRSTARPRNLTPSPPGVLRREAKPPRMANRLAATARPVGISR